MDLYDARAIELFTSLPGEIYSKYNLGNCQGKHLRKFYIEKDIKYIIHNEICIIGYQTKEDIIIEFIKNEKIGTTSASIGVYTLGGLYLFEGDKFELIKGDRIELYCTINE